MSQSVELVIEPRRRDLGGFEVGRVLPWSKRRMVGPFIFFDRMGPAHFPPNFPKGTDVRPHPHIGLATLTYLFAGEIVHRDSLGVHQVIRPGEVNWMIAGRGISHSERFETMREHGGVLDGLQVWIALPNEAEEVEPAFTHFDAHQLPSTELKGVRLTLIAGEAFGLTSPVPTFSPLFYVDAHIEAGASLVVEKRDAERAVYIANGSIEVDGVSYANNEMLVLAADAAVSIRANDNARVMLLGGAPVGPRHIWWNFVSSSRERIDQARGDWKAGRFQLPPDDNQEFIPLPEDPPPPAEPMS